MDLIVTLSITTLSMTVECRCRIFYCYAERHHAECRYAERHYAECRFAEVREAA